MEKTEWAPESLTPAEQILVDYLAEHGRAGTADFEKLCAAHPGLAGELRRLHEEWSRLDRVLGGPTDASGPFGKRNGEAHADGRVPREVAQLAELIERLEQHRPREPRYHVEGDVATGGMGVIRKVWDPDLRRHVAMKVLRKPSKKRIACDPYTGERTLGRFLDEAQITGQLEHPGIIPVHDLGVDSSGQVFFTMPLVRGRGLKEIIDLARAGEEGWSLARALGVLLKVCGAVAYAHSKGVIHRDLKPSNVMVGRFGETYVLDWGLARVMGEPDKRDLRLRRLDETHSAMIETDVREGLESTPDSPLVTLDGAVIGTPSYMPPEQAQGRIEELGPHSDVYSIGAMLYHLLAGHMPYVPSGSSASPHTVLAARLLGPPRPVLEVAPDASPELAAVCEKAMATEPERRYSAASELAADIEAYLSSRPVGAFESSPAYVLRLALRRNRTLALAAAAALGIAAAWGAWDVVTTRSALEREVDLRKSVQELADADAARVLAAEEGELHPAAPERLEAMRAWLERADGVLGRAEDRQAAALAPFELLAGLRASVAERFERASTLETRTIERHRERWQAAIDDIASLPIYGGLRIEPQVGLVPLQCNPSSGLWEFWVDGTGTEPRIADAATGAIARDSDAALVLALIPGGVVELGSPDTEAHRLPGEARVTVELAPFFLARTEVTQALWLRVMGSNPAQFRPGVQPIDDNWRELPVESVDWHQCAEFLRRAGLELPTEAQWERAARAGGAKAYGASDEFQSLAGFENFPDLGNGTAPGYERVPWEDGHRFTAPVASYLANPFGLFDVLGNVSEWCADDYVEKRSLEALRAGDGLVRVPGNPFRVIRGGNHYVPVAYARIAFRNKVQPQVANQVCGLRAARAVR